MIEIQIQKGDTKERDKNPGPCRAADASPSCLFSGQNIPNLKLLILNMDLSLSDDEDDISEVDFANDDQAKKQNTDGVPTIIAGLGATSRHAIDPASKEYSSYLSTNPQKRQTGSSAALELSSNEDEDEDSLRQKQTSKKRRVIEGEGVRDKSEDIMDADNGIELVNSKLLITEEAMDDEIVDSDEDSTLGGFIEKDHNELSLFSSDDESYVGEDEDVAKRSKKQERRRRLRELEELSSKEEEKEALMREKMSEIVAKMEENRSSRLFDLCKIPTSLSATLHPHQHLALSWLYTQETKFQCGMLCDDQGLGKTIEMISLMLKNTYENWKVRQERIKKSNEQLIDGTAKCMVPLPDGCLRTTLCVLPVSLIKQWNSEIEKFSNGILKVGVYDADSDRKTLANNFEDYDVILTTYAIMRIEGEEKEKRAADPAEPKRRRERFLRRDTLAKREMHFRDRQKNPEALNKLGPLFRNYWYRIILDESHIIKTSSTSTYRSACRLLAVHRWCVTGTPIHNTLDELYSQLSFLVNVPQAQNQSVWQRNIAKPIKQVVDMSLSRKTSTTISQKLAHNEKLAWQLLARCISKFVLRRTKYTPNPDNTLSLVPLPYKETFIRHIPLSRIERMNYNRLYACSRDTFNKYEGEGMQVLLKHIFVWLIRLRQFCNHPLLIAHALNDEDMMKTMLGDDEDENFEENNAEEEDISNIFDEKDADDESSADPALQNELNSMLLKLQTNDELRGVPVMKLRKIAQMKVQKTIIAARKLARKRAIEAYEHRQLARAEAQSAVLDGFYSSLQQQLNETREEMSKRRATFWPSSKLVAIIEDLIALRRQNSCLKALVFSQFTKFLDLIQHSIEKYGFNVVRLDGTMNQSQREVSLQRFREDPTVNVFLISLRAGGLGLNLISGSDVLIADPWWNESLEAQAIDRVHRIGQLKPVRVLRYLTTESIEADMLIMQEKKRALTAGAFSEKFQNAKTLTLKDLQNLFRKKVDIGEESLQNGEDGVLKTALELIYESLEKQLGQVAQGLRNPVGECIGPHPNRTPKTLIDMCSSMFFQLDPPDAVKALQRLSTQGHALEDWLSDLRWERESHLYDTDGFAPKDPTDELPLFFTSDYLGNALANLSSSSACNAEFADNEASAKIGKFMLNGNRVASVSKEALLCIARPSFTGFTSIRLECCAPLNRAPLLSMLKQNCHSLRELRLINCGHVLDDDTVQECLDICFSLRIVEFTCAYKLLKLDRIFSQANLTEIIVRDSHEAKISREKFQRLGFLALETLEVLDLSYCKNLIGQRRNTQLELQGPDPDDDAVSYVLENSPRLRILRCAGADSYTFNQKVLNTISTCLHGLEELDLSDCVDVFSSRLFWKNLVDSAPDLRVLRIAKCPIPTAKEREAMLERNQFEMETRTAAMISFGERARVEESEQRLVDEQSKVDNPIAGAATFHLKDISSTFLHTSSDGRQEPVTYNADITSAQGNLGAHVTNDNDNDIKNTDAPVEQGSVSDPFREAARLLLYQLADFSKLEVLDLALIDVVDDGVVRGVAKHCPNLHTAIFTGCSAISDHGVRSLAQLQKLQELDLSWCTAVSHDTVIGLLQHLPSLRTLRLYGCHELDIQAISEAMGKSTFKYNSSLCIWFG